MVVYMESLKNSKNINFHNIVVDGGMVKNDLFLQIIADLLRTEIKVPIIEEMSSYGSLLMGIQKNLQIQDLEELKNFKIDQKVIKPQLNSRIKGSYDGWKDTIHKHFIR